MQKMYEASKWNNYIKEIEVTRTTDKSYWENGRRNLRVTTDIAVFDTWEEAHAWLVEQYEGKCIAARKRIEYAKKELVRAKGILGNIQGMKEEK